MATSLETIETTFVRADRLLARAETDPELLRSFGRRPFDVLAESGVDGATFLRGLLGLPEASDLELVDVVRTRLGATARSSGCGIAVQGCGIAADGCGIAAEGCGIAVDGCGIAK